MPIYLKSILPSFSRPRGHVPVRGTTSMPRLFPTAYSTRIAAERCRKAESLVLMWFRNRIHHGQIEIVRRTRLQGAYIWYGALLDSEANMSKHVEVHQKERPKRKWAETWVAIVANISQAASMELRREYFVTDCVRKHLTEELQV